MYGMPHDGLIQLSFGWTRQRVMPRWCYLCGEPVPISHLHPGSFYPQPKLRIPANYDLGTDEDLQVPTGLDAGDSSQGSKES